jgi:lipoprotein signal peptidase
VAVNAAPGSRATGRPPVAAPPSRGPEPLRRLLVVTVLALGADQLTKIAAQLLLDGRTLLLAPGWGVTHVVNPGFWIRPEAAPGLVALASGAMIAAWLLPLAFTLRYRRAVRSSLAVDAFFGCYTLAVFGNTIDRLLVGGARDWLVTPVAVANLADLAVWPALAALGWEFWRHPPARRLFSIDPRRWWGGP